MKFRVVFLFISAIASIEAAWGGTPLRLCRPNNMVSAFAYLAEAQGFFERNGLDVVFETASNAKICQDLVLAGKADAYHGCEAPFSYIAAQNPPLRILAFLHLDPETALFVRNDNGIREPAELKGKRIGYLPGTTSFFYLAELLALNGLSLADVRLSPMQPPTLPQALIGGSVDAIVIWEPWGGNALRGLQQGGKRLFDERAYNCYATLFASNEFLTRDPAAAEALLRAEIEAESFSVHSPEQAQGLLSRALLLDSAYLKENWQGYEFKVHLGRGGIERMKRNYEWLRRTNQTAGRAAPDFESFIESRFLSAVLPARVGEVR